MTGVATGTGTDFNSYRDPEPEGRRKRGGRRRRATAWLSGRGEGRGEQALVPDAQFTSYSGRNVVKPTPWGPSIPAYLFLGGLAAGSQLLATGAHLTGNDALRRPTRITAGVALTLSAAALVEDLGKKSRFVNMLRTVKLTSPMSVGSWILSGYAAGTVPSVAAEVTRMVDLPGTALVRAADLVRAVETPTTLLGAFFSPPLAAYTAVLLSGTATPLWNEAHRHLPFVFVGSAAAASGGMAMLTTPVSHAGPARAFALLGVTADLVAMRVLEQHLGMVGEPLHQGRPGVLSKASTACNLAGLVGTLALGRSRAGAAVAGTAFLLGSLATRFAVFEAGMASARDPKYTVEPQRARLAARQQQQGAVRDSITTGPGIPEPVS